MWAKDKMSRLVAQSARATSGKVIAQAISQEGECGRRLRLMGPEGRKEQRGGGTRDPHGG